LVRALTIALDDRAGAEDAAQAAFAQARRQWSTVATSQRPAAWVLVEAVRAGHRGRRRELAAPAPELLGPITDRPDTAAFGRSVPQALGELAPRQRIALVLVYLADLSVPEVAAALGCSVGEAEATLHTARSRLGIADDADNADELRQALAGEAERQPPLLPGFPAGVDRHRHPTPARLALLALPLVVLAVLIGVVVLVTGLRDNQTVATTDRAAGPAATSSTVRAAGPGDRPSGGACGTVTVEAQHLATHDTEPLDCFVRAVDGGQPADVTVVLSGPDGGSITERLTARPGRVVMANADGSIRASLPSVSLGGGSRGGGGGGVVPSQSDDEVVACDTVTVTAGERPATGRPSPLAKVAQCLLPTLTGAGSAHVTVAINGNAGGSMAATIDLGSDHKLTLALTGALTMNWPAGVTSADQVLGIIPTGITGLGPLLEALGQ
jgi:DNA-directed RNA polymerase specialized sigma24 family protein